MAHPFSSLEYCLRIKPDYFFLEEYKSFSFNVGERSVEASPKRVYLRSRDHLVPLAKMSVFVSCFCCRKKVKFIKEINYKEKK